LNARCGGGGGGYKQRTRTQYLEVERKNIKVDIDSTVATHSYKLFIPLLNTADAQEDVGNFEL
jgi:hypothetical protein